MKFFLIIDPLEQFLVFKICGISSIFIFLLLITLIFFVCEYLCLIELKFTQFNNYKTINNGLYEIVRSTVYGNINMKLQIYFPLFFCLFILILFSNIVGLIPFSFTTTRSFILTLYYALILFIVVILLVVCYNKIFFKSIEYLMKKLQKINNTILINKQNFFFLNKWNVILVLPKIDGLISQFIFIFQLFLFSIIIISIINYWCTRLNITNNYFNTDKYDLLFNYIIINYIQIIFFIRTYLNWELNSCLEIGSINLINNLQIAALNSVSFIIILYLIKYNGETKFFFCNLLFNEIVVIQIHATVLWCLTILKILSLIWLQFSFHIIIINYLILLIFFFAAFLFSFLHIFYKFNKIKFYVILLNLNLYITTLSILWILIIII